jgi:hypothetical protein
MKKKDATYSNTAATKKDVEKVVESAVAKMAEMIGRGFTQNDKRFDTQR